MTLDDIGSTLRIWRKASGMKQQALAQLLSVTQATVSRWENGLDLPSPTQCAKLRSVIGRELRSPIEIERLILGHQVGMRALIDVDGVRLIAMTAGFKSLWQEMVRFEGQQLADYLTGMSRDLYTDPDILRLIRTQDIAVISGVTDRHFERIGGEAFKHSWSATYRKIGTRHYAEVTFDTCDPDAEIGISHILRLDTL